MKNLIIGLILANVGALDLLALDIVSPLDGPPIRADVPFFVPTIRYQQVYAASDFQAQVPTGGLITEIWFRAYGTDFFGTLPHVEISLSTTAKSVDGLSSTFAENVGADSTVVVNGSIALSSNDAGVPFTTRIALSQPFHYNPSAGNLLLDIRDYQ